MAKFKKNPLEELAKEINAKARELQNVQESVANEFIRIRELAERKRKLNSELGSIEQQIKEAKRNLDETTERERKFLTDNEKEAAESRVELEALKKELSAVKKELDESVAVLKEIEGYKSLLEQTRTEYVCVKDELGAVEKKYRDLIDQGEKTKAEVAKEKKELGEAKTELHEFYGKVASYARQAQEILAYVNEAIENKAPIRFTLPPGIEVLEIDIDNFDKP